MTARPWALWARKNPTAGLSRRPFAKAAQPIVVIISQSGAGKSTLAVMLEQLAPEDVLFYSRITQQALYYMSEP